MKNITIKSLAMLMMIGALAVLSFAQDVRVQLTAGGETKSFTRTLAPNGSATITFKANAGQTIGFTAGYDGPNDNDLLAYLLSGGSDGGEQLAGSKAKAPNEFSVKKNGDYRVVVQNNTNRRVTTTIYLDLFNPEEMQDDSSSDIPTEALNFEGSDQGNVSKTIPANGTMKFTFDGTKGATAIVNVTERTNKLTVIFNENENQKADTTIAINRDVSRKLTRTGKHTIEVVNETAKPIKFDLAVTLGSFSDSSSAAQTATEEVRFATGKTDAFLKRTLNANGTIEFTFFAKKGQRVNYSVNYNMGNNRNSTDLELFFMETGGQDFIESGIADEPNEYRVKTSGIHTVQVVNKTGKKVSFEFGLSIL